MGYTFELERSKCKYQFCGINLDTYNIVSYEDIIYFSLNNPISNTIIKGYENDEEGNI